MSTEREQGSLVAQQAVSVASVEPTGAPTPLRTAVTTSRGEPVIVPAISVSQFPSLTMTRNEMETGSLLSSPKRTKAETHEVPGQAPTSESPEQTILDEAKGQAILLLGSGTGAGGALPFGSVLNSGVSSTSSYATELFPLSYRSLAPESVAATMLPAAYNQNSFLPEATSGEMYPTFCIQGLQSMAPAETYPDQVSTVVLAPSSLNSQPANELLSLAMHNSEHQSGDSRPIATLIEPDAGGAYEVIQHRNGVGYEVAHFSNYLSQYDGQDVSRQGDCSPTPQRASWMTLDHPTRKYASSLRLNTNSETISAPANNSRPSNMYTLSLRRDADNQENLESYFSSQQAQTDPRELDFNLGYGTSTFDASEYSSSTNDVTGMSYSESNSNRAPDSVGNIMFNMLNRGGASLSLLSHEEPQMDNMSSDVGGSQDQESLLDSPVRETGSHNAFATAHQALAERAQDFATLNSTYVQVTPGQTVNEGYNTTWRNNELVFLEGIDAQARDQSFSDQLNAQLEQTDNDIVQYGSSKSAFPFQAHHHSFFQTHDLPLSPRLVDSSQSATLAASQSSFSTQVYQHSFFQTNDPSPPELVTISQNLSLTMASEQPPSTLFNKSNSDRQSLMLHSSQGYTNRGLERLDTELDFLPAITSTSTPLRDSRNESSEGQYMENLHRFLPCGQGQLDDVPLPMGQDYPVYQNVHAGNTYTGRDQFQASSRLEFNQRRTLGDIVRVLLNELVTLDAESCRQRTTATHDRQGTTQAGGSQASSMAGGSSLENNHDQALALNDGIGAEMARLEYMLSRGKRTLSSTLNSHFTDSLLGEQIGMFAAPFEENTDHLESRKQKLFVFIQQVDGSWRTYSGHLIEIISYFNSLTCPEAAKSYTALAHQSMSRYFKGLRDALCGEYRAVKRLLGEQERAPVYKRRQLSTNQFLDGQLRQHIAVQQLQEHAWRPQRGLPERAVIVLRSWLLEHFLHPYPKDGDKILLAKQTGLTRNQVSNWFINARVRLWKPMVEEMYADEFVSDQTGSRERSPPRPLSPPTQMLDFSQIEIGAATSNGQAEALRLNVDERYFPHFSSLEAMRSGSASDSKDFDTDLQAGVHTRRKARYGPSSYSEHTVGMNMDVPVVHLQDQCKIDQGTSYGSSPAEDYIRQQEILTSNRARYSAHQNTRDSLTGLPSSFVLDLIQASNPRVSLTLGLESLSGVFPQQRPGFQREQMPAYIERSAGHPGFRAENTVRNMDSGSSSSHFDPVPHNSSPGSFALAFTSPPFRRQRGAIPQYQLREYIAREDAPAAFLPESLNDGGPGPL